MRPFGEVALPPREFLHTSEGLSALSEALRLIDGNTRVILEATGRYHEPVVMALQEAGFFVSAVNPKLIKDFGNNSLRKVKTDKADAVKIARYGLEYWEEMREYTETDTTRQQLKLFSRQYNLHMGPPEQKIAGRFSRRAAISIPGTILSQLGMNTNPSNGWALAIISTESAICSRLGRE